MKSCPSDLSLEEYLIDPERAEVAGHVASCPGCQARVAEMRRIGDEFQRDVYPATLGSMIEAARPRRMVPVWILVAVPIAAAVLVFLGLQYFGGARRGIDLAVYVGGAVGARPIGDGAEVPADASLSFEVHPSSPCCLWVLAVDSSGEITRVYPPKGDRASEAIIHPPRPHELPTRALLDGRVGPQRLFAVCTKSPVPWLTVKQAAAETVPKGADAVRAVRSIGGLPAGAVQTTVLIEKRS